MVCYSYGEPCVLIDSAGGLNGAVSIVEHQVGPVSMSSDQWN